MDHTKILTRLAGASELGAFTLPAVPGYPRWPSPIAQTHGDDRAPRVTKRGPGRRHISGRREVASLGGRTPSDHADRLPRGYPGAKLARKALQTRKTVGAYREPKVGRIGVRGLT